MPARAYDVVFVGGGLATLLLLSRAAGASNTVERKERMSPFASVMLLATDGSGRQNTAARMAVELSRALGSELHATYVEPIPEPLAWPESAILNPEDKTLMRERAEENARERLTQEAERIKGMGGKFAEAHARSGRPDAEIVRLAEELGSGLVIVGSRGLGSMKRALLGSVSAP
jgi:nucleotide-binding universal stress UspA family protein